MHISLRGLTVLIVMLIAVPTARAQQADPADPAPAQTPRPVAIEYSPGYELRAKIHRYASIPTLPLVGAEMILGTALYNESSAHENSMRGEHIAVGTAITSLFVVNTATGVWNMWSSRKDPHHRTLRLVHGMMMLGADAGFVAAFGTGPSGKNLITYDSNKRTHRTIALTSLGVAAGSYLIMLFGNR